MKKLITLVLMMLVIGTYAQKTDLGIVNTVRPKKGQKVAVETAYKLHVSKFHKTADQKVTVYEIMSGPNAGCFHLVEGGKSFADFDKTRPDAAAHALDLDKTFYPLLEETMNGVYRFMDTLSLHPNVQAEAFVVTVRHLKTTLDQTVYRRELSRGVKINNKLKGAFIESLSTAYYEQLWDGTDQVAVLVRGLKDGFKSLETNYYGPPAPGNAFREEYEKTYGFAAYDERVKILDNAIEKTEQYIMRLRKDLGTP